MPVTGAQRRVALVVGALVAAGVVSACTGASDSGTRAGSPLPAACANPEVLIQERFNGPLGEASAWKLERLTTIGSTLEITSAELNGQAAPTPPYLHAAVSDPPDAAGNAYYAQTFEAATLQRAVLDYDLAWNYADGYAELGCVLKYQRDQDVYAIDLQIDGSSGALGMSGLSPTPPASLYAGVSYPTPPMSDTKALATISPPEFEVHHLTSELSVVGGALYFGASVDGGERELAPPIVPIVPLTELEVDCGVIYDPPPVGGTTRPKVVDVAIDNVTLAVCR